jgi:hypothetical protein
MVLCGSSPFTLEGAISRPSKATLAKRAREKAKHERQQEKEERRAQRKEAKQIPRRNDGEDPDLAGMRPGPQAPLY